MQYGVLVGFILACQAIGFLGSLPTMKAIPTWYAQLNRPAWTPPNWLFGPVWTLLYLLMAIAAWQCWRTVGFAGWLMPFGVQLGLNLAWSWIFFGLKRLGWALAEMALLWLSIIWCLVTFQSVSATAGMLLIPYLLWVTYAFTLNAGYWALNRQNA